MQERHITMSHIQDLQHRTNDNIYNNSVSLGIEQFYLKTYWHKFTLMIPYINTSGVLCGMLFLLSMLI